MKKIKKSIKIIILILLIVSISNLVFAAQISDYLNLENDKIKQLSIKEIKIAIKVLVAEYSDKLQEYTGAVGAGSLLEPIDIPQSAQDELNALSDKIEVYNNEINSRTHEYYASLDDKKIRELTISDLDHALEVLSKESKYYKKYKEERQYRNSTDYYISLTDDQIEKMERSEAKTAIITIEEEINSASHSLDELEQALRKYKNKIDKHDIYYYMDNMSNSKNLYREMTNLTEDELYEGEIWILNNCYGQFPKLGTYFFYEAKEKKEEYAEYYKKALRKNALDIADNWDTNKKYVKSLGKSKIEKYKEALEEAKKEGIKLADGDGAVLDQTIKYYDGKISILNSILEYLEEQEKVAIAIIDYNGYNPSQPQNYDEAIIITGNVLAIVRNIGLIVAVISLSIIGIKYIFGSAEEKAEYKKTLVPFTIGLILFAAIVSLVSFVFSIVNGLF